MKKLTSLILMILVLFSVSLYAGDYTLGSDADNTETVKLSANVDASYHGDSDGSHYVAATMNSKGTKMFGTADNETVIYTDDCTGTPPDCADDNVSSTVSNYNSGYTTVTGWDAIN